MEALDGAPLELERKRMEKRSGTHTSNYVNPADIYTAGRREDTHTHTRIIHTGKRLIEKCVILISIRFVSRGVGVHVPHDRGRARGALKMDYLCAGLSREESGYFSFILEILLDLNYPHTPSDLPRDRSALYGANGAVK